MVALFMGSLGASLIGVAMAWLVFSATAGAERFPLARMVRGLFVIVAFLMVTLFPVLNAVPVFLLLWTLWWLVFWRFGQNLTRPGSEAHYQVRRFGRRIGLALGISSILSIMAALLEPNLLFGVLAATAALVGIAAQGSGAAIDALWPLPSAPSTVLKTVRLRLREYRELLSGYGDDVLWLRGPLAGEQATISLDLRMAPARLEIDLTLPNAPRGLVMRARREGEEGGVAFSDPLLRRTLFVEGISERNALAMIGSDHATVLEVLHAWPDSQLSNRRLTVRIPGPPFDARRVGEDDEVQTPEWIADFVLRRVSEVENLCAMVQRHDPLAMGRIRSSQRATRTIPRG